MTVTVQVHYTKVKKLTSDLVIRFSVLPNLWGLYILIQFKCNSYYFVFLMLLFLFMCSFMIHLFVDGKRQLTFISSLFYHSASGGWIQVVRIQRECFFSMSYLTSPIGYFDKRKACVYLIKTAFLSIFNPLLVEDTNAELIDMGATIHTNIKAQDTSKDFDYTMKFYWNKYLWQHSIIPAFNCKVDLRISRNPRCIFQDFLVSKNTSLKIFFLNK